jgi:hypothetical protein
MTFDTSVLRKPWPPLNRRNGHAPLDHDIGELIQRLPIRCPSAGKMKISGGCGRGAGATDGQSRNPMPEFLV